MNEKVNNAQRYTTIVIQLAKQSLEAAVDAAPHRAREGERRWALANALPAARVLCDLATDVDCDALPKHASDLAATLAASDGKTTDGFGHHRPAYALLAIHLLGTAALLLDDQATLASTRQAATTLLNQDSTNDPDPRLAVWRRLIAQQHGLSEAEELPIPSEGPAPLVPLGLNDLIDSWTYRELVGIHGLHLCTLSTQEPSLADRVESATLYHLGHTQPDYTTYQPWGLAAFASNPQTAVFAEQQLHDVATHLSIEGPGGAVIPALLLADAAATMAGRLTTAWAKP